MVLEHLFNGGKQRLEIEWQRKRKIKQRDIEGEKEAEKQKLNTVCVMHNKVIVSVYL